MRIRFQVVKFESLQFLLQKAYLLYWKLLYVLYV